MTARTVSRQAYDEHIASGHALRQSDRVYAAIKARPKSTRAELARDTGIEKTSICGRVKELLKAGRIEEVEGVKCSVKGNVVHGLVPAREFHGGSSEGYSPAQIKLWEDRHQFPHYPHLARFVLAQPRENQEQFYRNWKKRHGDDAAAKLAAAIRVEKQQQQAAA